MLKNEGFLDRITRLSIGITLIILAFKLEANQFTVVLYVIGVISIATAITGFCALYKACGIETLKK